MSKFFINRPIFAWVIAIFVIIAGLVTITMLPVSQYPRVAPTTIRIMSTYPGADAKTVDEAVNSLIEREMSGIDGLMYMESKALAVGQGEITITFAPGIDEKMAQVDVQNRLARAEPRLPAMVKQIGVQVDTARSNFLMMVALRSSNPAIDANAVADYANRNIRPELQRVAGVGNAQIFSSGYALRVWVDPAKLEGYGMAMEEVNNAIRTQNLQISAGSLGASPGVPGQTMTATITVPGQLTDIEQFENIVLRALPNGSVVRLRDVARLEMGGESYFTTSRIDGKPGTVIAIQLNASGNALATAEAVKTRMAELEPFFPSGVEWLVPYDTSTFVDVSIKKVVWTLLEAIVLVFIVMYIFLQNWRYTIIPTIVVPIALLGTFAVLLAAGMSINILAMFAMVLVIGIVVDDAIVVVENVERIMDEEGLPPKQATIKAMRQIAGAVVGITVILVSVFIPLAFFTGATGNIYRQFSIVMAVSIAFSGFFALTLTPALCATLLKPIPKGHDHSQKTGPFGPFFNWFNRNFARGTKAYESAMAKVLKRGLVMMGVYVAIIAAVGLMYMRLPTSFLPEEDQGTVILNVQLPPGASQERTLKVLDEVEKYMLAQPEVQNIITIQGFSFSGQGTNVGMAFTTLKNWSERTAKGSDARSLANRASMALSRQREAFVLAVTPPAIPELGNSSGFTFRLLDRGDQGHEAMLGARAQLLAAAAQSPLLMGVRPEGVEDAPQWQININRDAVYAQNVSMAAIASTLSTAMGSSYVNDFPNAGRMQRVTVQAEAARRMQPEDVLALKVPSNTGKLVPLSTMVSTRWVTGPMQLQRYNSYPSMSIAGMAAPGKSSGDAMAEMERLAADLPDGFGYEWTGMSLDEKKSGDSSMILYAFSILAVFLCLAALYESWSIPLSVILVIPLGVLGTLIGVFLRGMPNDIYFQIALITVIGLSAKNAILIVEFAKDLQEEGMGLVEATLQAAHLRIRPILMTSLAFILGVVPLYISSGASSASQRAVGTGVLWGMTIGTILSVFLVPVFYLVVRRLFQRNKDNQAGPGLPAPGSTNEEVAQP
ncbi:MAG: efflux RND transporter permease subunit [Brachymonas sp.]|nr:efflux RND transporter permease subunit [Brachymonas sp.]